MPTFYIDLDRTTFRTERVNVLYETLQKLYPDNAAIAQGYTSRTDYYVLSSDHDGDGDRLYCHDFGAQLAAMGLDTNEVYTALLARLGDGQFEYPGTRELVEVARAKGEVKVLTYGTDNYQRFKAALCPSLKGIEVITVLEPKSHYLNMYAHDGDWMIDDKELLNVKAGVRVVRVGHGDRVTAKTSSLEDVAARIVAEA